MPDKTQADATAITVGVVDDVYCAWFTAESESEVALRLWFNATPAGRDLAYRVYVAALDREEAAARDLERRTDAAAANESVAAQP